MTQRTLIVMKAWLPLSKVLLKSRARALSRWTQSSRTAGQGYALSCTDAVRHSCCLRLLMLSLQASEVQHLSSNMLCTCICLSAALYSCSEYSNAKSTHVCMQP